MRRSHESNYNSASERKKANLTRRKELRVNKAKAHLTEDEKRAAGGLKGFSAFLVIKMSYLASGARGGALTPSSTIPTLSSLCLTYYESI